MKGAVAVTPLSKSNRGGALAAQQVRAEATRASLVSAARAMFAAAGYHSTGMNDVVTRASVTRGALYHHFTDKQDLFEAVFRQVSEELNRAARDAVASLSGNIWWQFVGALKAYLESVASNAGFQQVILIDGPAVLGWRRWRTLQSEWVETGIANTLTVLMEEGVVARGPTGPLAFLLQAALNDAALSIARAPDPQTANSEMSDALMRILEGLRIKGP